MTLIYLYIPVLLEYRDLAETVKPLYVSVKRRQKGRGSGVEQVVIDSMYQVGYISGFFSRYFGI